MFLTFAQTASRLGAKSRSFVYDRIAEGTLPRPVQVGARALRFPNKEIEEIIKARIAGRSKAEIQALVDTLHAKRKFPASTGLPALPKDHVFQMSGGA